MRFGRVVVFSVIACAGAAAPARAQDHQHAHPAANAAGWTFHQDGVVFAMFNHQGGPRGGQEFMAPNWWMGMASRQRGRHQFTFTAMLSFDAATNTRDGYRQLFQAGETLDGEPLIDAQHPHDFLSQLAASWRIASSSNDSRALTLAAALSGEATLGPVAFVHRASAAGWPMAPLGHHTFDSTHISFGVVAASFDVGRWTVEASAFNGREPDDHRWDVDLGPLDSFAGRVWFRPSPQWAIQVSTGKLTDPEELEPGDVHRTTASASWTRLGDDALTAVTGAWGMNSAHGTQNHGAFVEMTRERGARSVFGRFEVQQLELDSWEDVAPVAHGEQGTVVSLTIGAALRVFSKRTWEGAFGGEVIVSRAPSALAVSHGSYPVAAQLFFRVRLPTGPMGRMWNHTMTGTR